MTSDSERWDGKYAGREFDALIRPDPLLLEYAARLPTQGRSLDVAAGLCDNACLLAKLGLDSFAVDISVLGLALCRAKARANGISVMAFVADLSSYVLPAAAFDVISVTRFLDRRIIPHIQASLRPGGWIFYKTFNRNFLETNPGFRPEFVLAERELSDLFSAWELVDSNEGEQNKSEFSHWVGRKPS